MASWAACPLHGSSSLKAEYSWALLSYEQRLAGEMSGALLCEAISSHSHFTCTKRLCSAAVAELHTRRWYGKGRIGEVALSLLSDNCSYPSRTWAFSTTKKLTVYFHSKSPFFSLQNPVTCWVRVCWGKWKCSFKLSCQFRSVSWSLHPGRVLR